MRILVQRDTLIRELDLLRPLFTEKAGLTPGVQLTADNGRFTAFSTDLWNHMTTGGEATVPRPGKITLRGAYFLDLLKLLPKGEITLDSSAPGTLSLEIDDFKAQLVTLIEPVTCPPAHVTVKTVIKSGDLLSLIKQMHNILSDEISTAKAALLACGDTAFRMVATDGHRLAMADVGNLGDSPKNLLLGRKTVDRLKAVLADYKGDVTLEYGEGNDLVITVGHRIWQTRLVSMQYPPYERIIPTSHELQIHVDPDGLAAAARRTVLMLEKPDEAVLTLSVEAERLTVQADGGREQGTASEVVECRTEGTVPYELRLRAKYLIDALYAVDAKSVSLSCGKEYAPQAVAIRPEGYQAVFLVMPIGKSRPTEVPAAPVKKVGPPKRARAA
jgi:DNA polymerase-3 subunit beta